MLGKYTIIKLIYIKSPCCFKILNAYFKMIDLKNDISLSVLSTLYIAYKLFFILNYWNIDSGISLFMANKNRYDIRDDYKCKALNHVFDQGLCPACFAFALASAIGTKIFMRNGKEMIPSPYRIFDCAGKDCQNNDVGMNLMDIERVMKIGVPDIRESPNVFGWGCHVGSIQSKHFRKVCGISRIKEEIFVHGPVIIIVELDSKKNIPLKDFNEWDDLFLSFGDSGIKGHGVIAIGWADSYWIIKNSWGTQWGANGTGRVPWAMTPCALSFDVLIDTLDAKHD